MARESWFTGSDGSCHGCHQGYMQEHEHRCTGCDRAFCHFCIVRVNPGVPGSPFDFFCADCETEPGDPPEVHHPPIE